MGDCFHTMTSIIVIDCNRKDCLQITYYEIRDFLFHLLIKHFLYFTIKCVDSTRTDEAKTKSFRSYIRVPFHSSLPLHILSRAHIHLVSQKTFFFCSNTRSSMITMSLPYCQPLSHIIFSIESVFRVFENENKKRIKVVNLTKNFFYSSFWYGISNNIAYFLEACIQ